eukprot:TRINITY_DN17235_c0_g1_i1.p1 TRINITY_DN17235_c0_g1~~TRINITY_DN17235_c0_g1_i1.p1  ORF type:complete len:414 (-),score=99.09 TRINITY_DN17235_c0_g1_i1:16-1257(-)
MLGRACSIGRTLLLYHRVPPRLSHFTQICKTYTPTPIHVRSMAIMDRYDFHRKKKREEEEALRQAVQKANTKEDKPIDDADDADDGNIAGLSEDQNAFLWRPPVQPAAPRSLNLALIGAPNAGKSTLVNSLVGTKVSIVSPKSQTTRDQVLGVDTQDNSQLVFFDTPGVVNIGDQKGILRSIVVSAWEAVSTSDIVLVIIDAAKKLDEDVIHILRELEANRVDINKKLELDDKSASEKQYILVLNKIDWVKPKDKVLPLIERLNETKMFSDTFVVSALKGHNIQKLRTYLHSKSVLRPWVFPKEAKSDQSDYHKASEIIREKIYRRLNLEVPYAVRQVNMGWTNLANGDLRIDQNIIVPKAAQKMILVGRQGRVINYIFKEATEELERIFNRKVRLRLTVQHKPHHNYYSDPY